MSSISVFIYRIPEYEDSGLNAILKTHPKDVETFGLLFKYSHVLSYTMVWGFFSYYVIFFQGAEYTEIIWGHGVGIPHLSFYWLYTICSDTQNNFWKCLMMFGDSQKKP